MVWSFTGRDDKVSSHQKNQQQHSTDSSSFSPSPTSASNHYKQAGGMKKGSRLRSSVAPAAGKGKVHSEAPLIIEEMNVLDTSNGIEVSYAFPGGHQAEEREPREKPREPVISIKEQIRQRQKVYRTQFSVSFPALQQSSSVNDVSFDNWRPKDHRIPLLGYSMVDVSYQDVMGLLQNSQVSDEHSSVQEELKQLDIEISALDKDRSWLKTSLWNVSKSFPSFSPTGTPKSRNKGVALNWDVRTILGSTALQEVEQLRLQAVRGNCLTLNMQNPNAREAFLSKCGNKHVKPLSNKRRAPGYTVTLDPGNCKPGGAGATVRHVSVMSGGTGANATSSFFISRDTGKSFTWGRFPPKLFRRMKENDNGDLVYLSTGPQGSYYAEFRSGECWWGSAVDDNDFHSILQAWDVYRVVFGPIIAFEDERGNKHMTNSWIILGRDGRAAWKNLPSRLHHQLESRLANQSTPAEVALGSGDSYYVRYLDNTQDYCLPAVVAEVCEHIELHGGSITDIALHPEISHDFVIRHTEMKS
jgi:hypothetical protein